MLEATWWLESFQGSGIKARRLSEDSCTQLISDYVGGDADCTTHLNSVLEEPLLQPSPHEGKLESFHFTRGMKAIARPEKHGQDVMNPVGAASGIGRIKGPDAEAIFR